MQPGSTDDLQRILNLANDVQQALKPCALPYEKALEINGHLKTFKLLVDRIHAREREAAQT